MPRLFDVRLLPWPCGCVSDGNKVPPRAAGYAAFQCPWCDAVVTQADFQRWFLRGQIQFPVIQQPRALLRVGEMLLEAGGSCEDCDTTLVRQARTRDAKWGHLNVPMSKIQILKD